MESPRPFSRSEEDVEKSYMLMELKDMSGEDNKLFYVFFY